MLPPSPPKVSFGEQHSPANRAPPSLQPPRSRQQLQLWGFHQHTGSRAWDRPGSHGFTLGVSAPANSFTKQDFVVSLSYQNRGRAQPQLRAALSPQQPHLWAPKALMTVERRRPSLAVTWVMYCGRPSSDSSTDLERAALPGQSHREPGRWQQSPVVMAAPCPSVPGPAPGRPAGTAPRSEPCSARPLATLQPLRHQRHPRL